MRRALVFGRAKGVWDEVEAAKLLCSYDYVIAVGSAGLDYSGHIDCWVTYHASLFPDWAKRRERKGFNQARLFVSVGSPPRYRRGLEVFPVTYVRCQGGSSGLIATIAALDVFKAERVVLAGIPMEADRGQYDTNAPWREANKHRAAWEAHTERLLGKVRSMSGWTQKLLGGPPTVAWLTLTCAVGHHNYVGKCPYCQTVLEGHKDTLKRLVGNS